MRIDDTQEFLAYWDRLRARTLRVARVIPAEQIEWRPQEGAFSFGDILRHLASIERFMFVENALLRPSRYPGHSEALAAGHAAIFEYLDRMHRESLDLLSGLTAADLGRKTETPGGAAITVWKWLRAMAEHEIHHRGQIYIHLSTLGIATPPLYGLTSEEVHRRSLT